MSGPALKQWDSHSSIHEAALGEAEQLTELLRRCVEREDEDKASEVACIVVEHWETRTLRHAESEEEGLYIELVEQHPEMKETVIALTRDHSLMRRLVGEIKGILGRRGSMDGVLKRLEALILVDLLHNEDEGKMIRWAADGKGRGDHAIESGAS